MKRSKKRHREQGESVREQEAFACALQEEAEKIFQQLEAGESSAPATPGHKVGQLLAQAEEAIALALAASRDPALHDLQVAAVNPIRGGACLEVVVSPGDPGADLGWIEEKLTRARGYLRGELAAAIHRKRTPELVFVVVPVEAVEPGMPGDGALAEEGEEVDDDER